MRVTCAQIEIDGGDLDGNVRRAAGAVARAAADGADLVVLPELFTVGYFAYDAYARRAESLTGPTLTGLAEVAADRGVALLAGTVVEDLAATAEAGVPVPDTSGLANTAVLFDTDGNRRAVHRTQDLPGYATGPPIDPAAGVPAVEPLELDGETVTVGVTTTDDLGSPGVYRKLAEAGCELVCAPSAWPYPRVERWAVLARARAIENEYYVAAANGSGEFEEATLMGRSTVYDPMGAPLASSGDEPALVNATVDPTRIRRVRESSPVRGTRRPG